MTASHCHRGDCWVGRSHRSSLTPDQTCTGRSCPGLHFLSCWREGEAGSLEVSPLDLSKYLGFWSRKASHREQAKAEESSVIFPGYREALASDSRPRLFPLSLFFPAGQRAVCRFQRQPGAPPPPSAAPAEGWVVRGPLRGQ